MMLKPLTMLLALPLISAAAPLEDYAEPYRILKQANQTLDASLAASAYASDGALVFEYIGRPREEFRGREAIRASYVRTFAQVEPGTRIELDFRFDPPGPGPNPQSGTYRAKARAAGQQVTLYGRFKVKLVKQDGHWRFAEDYGTVGSAADFEKLPE